MTIAASALAVFSLACALAAVLWPAMAQPLSYHDFADCRSWLTVPNTLNVLSNLPFAVAGVLGMHAVASPAHSRFHLDSERLPYLMFFMGATLTCFGSMYYHWLPDNPHLVWDRLPMTMAFSGLVSAVIAERINLRFGSRMLWPLVALGALSVYYWHATEQLGHGNVIPYGVFQVWSIVVLMVVVLFWPAGRYSHGAVLTWPIALYAAAKIAETFDLAIWRASSQWVSGHTIKHLLAAAAVFAVYRMIVRREPLPARP